MTIEKTMLQRNANKHPELQRSKSWRGRKAALKMFSLQSSYDDTDDDGGDSPRPPPDRPRESVSHDEL